MKMQKRIASVAAFVALSAGFQAFAHCDTLDGPVVAAARKALDTGNANHVLVWVQPRDEAEIRAALDKARTVRKGGAEARSLADTYFFETLVRVHRAGEGADYTGLKPAGRIEPPVAVADKAIESGRLQPLGKLVSERIEKGLHAHFDAVMAKKKYAPDDVAAGREYASAYVEFVHYAERLYGAAENLAPEQSTKPATGHAH
jgi:hypothetical protein